MSVGSQSAACSFVRSLDVVALLAVVTVAFLLGLDRYRYPVSDVGADTYFNVGTDTSSSFTCLNSQHCCMHARSFKLIVCLIRSET